MYTAALHLDAIGRSVRRESKKVLRCKMRPSLHTKKNHPQLPSFENYIHVFYYNSYEK